LKYSVNVERTIYIPIPMTQASVTLDEPIAKDGVLFPRSRIRNSMEFLALARIFHVIRTAGLTLTIETHQTGSKFINKIHLITSFLEDVSHS
jgi:hypothetical protein